MGGQGPGDFQSLPLRQAQGMGHVMSKRGDSGLFKDLIDLAIRFGSRTAGPPERCGLSRDDTGGPAAFRQSTFP
jgi:hypothetical protein